MNRLKWYDFLGAIILLVSVTKSAIKPVVVEPSRTLASPPASTALTPDSQMNTPREASLSQIDVIDHTSERMLSGISFTADAQGVETNTRYGIERHVRNSSTAKSLAKSAFRTELTIDQDGDGSASFHPLASSTVVVFIC